MRSDQMRDIETIGLIIKEADLQERILEIILAVS